MVQARYGRVVARLFAGDEDVDRAMVGQGNAWAYRQYLTDETLIATESRARRQTDWAVVDERCADRGAVEWRQGVRVGTGDIDGSKSGQGPQRLFTPPPGSGSGAAGDGFRCSGKQYCRQMSSCAEAQFNLRQCGVRTLDGDGDGQRCEIIC
ncbi:MAG: thermonuclease family protein [Brevundimonas sp.]